MVHGHPGEPRRGHGQDEALFNMNSKDFGGLCGYVDDRTYTFASSDPATLSRVVSEKYKKLAKYMNDNRLVIIDDKTH